MRIEITEVDGKDKKIHYDRIIIMLLIILLITFSFYDIKVNPENKIDNTSNIINEKLSIHVLKINGIVEKKQTMEEKKLPVLTEIGFDNVTNLYYGEEKTAYLTFDDGPTTNVTPLILDVLKENNVKATFFVLGKMVDRNPEIVKRAYDEGHYIANHGYYHIYKDLYSSKESVLNEYVLCNQAVINAIGKSEYNSHLFRFPGGSVGNKYANIISEAIVYLRENNVTYVDWNALTGDAAGMKTLEAQQEELYNTTEGKNVVVVLMHDASDKILTYENLQNTINNLKDRGYSFKNFYDVIK